MRGRKIRQREEKENYDRKENIVAASCFELYTCNLLNIPKACDILEFWDDNTGQALSTVN